MNERPAPAFERSEVDSGYAWVRLLAAVALGTIGGVGMWSVVVVLPSLEKDFGLTRSEASLSYTLAMIGFGLGGVLMGRLSDRLGIFRPLISCIIVLALGYIGTAFAETNWQFAVAYGVLIALFGSAITFGPLIADTSLWFARRRGIAVGICASGNYLAGTIWPPVVERLLTAYGWRATHIGIGLFCLLAMLPITLLLRRPSPVAPVPATGASATAPGLRPQPPPVSLPVLQALLITAGVCCCLAMSMPQVHIVAYCSDLGYGVARGAEMLSLMLGFGIVSRLASGFIADRIGGMKTLLLGSIMQAVALLLYVPFDGLMSLYVVSALFGLFQGGIVPSYAIVIREYFPASEAGARVGVTLTATLIGMALGGWLSGLIFDVTGSYRIAFLNGFFWNAVNIGIVLFLIVRARQALRA
ncbi:MAG: MFS transporter [Hyphomicrobiaceae bacterium]